MPEAARVITTDSEIDLAIKKARQFEKFDRRVVRAAFSGNADKLRLTMDDGVVCLIPRKLIQGLSGAPKRMLTPIQVLGGGTGLLWPLLDVAHSVPGLLSGVYGSRRWMDQLKSDSRDRKIAARSFRSNLLIENGKILGIDGHHREANEVVREKSGNTLVGTLRKVYGEDFLSDWRSDAKLSSVRAETDMSLSEMVRQHRLGKRLAPPRGRDR